MDALRTLGINPFPSQIVNQSTIFLISNDLNELNDKDNEVNKMRVKRGFKARRRRKRVLKLAKGFRGGRSKLFRTAADAVDKALMYSYRDRRAR